VELKEHVAEIVAAYVRRNPVSADQLTQTIIAVHDALARLGQEPEPIATQEPAVPIRRSIKPDRIICLECGKGAKMLRRHLANAHDLTPDSYRTKWELDRDYPMTAPAYAQHRSEFAKAIGLGRKGRGAPPEQPAPPDNPESITEKKRAGIAPALYPVHQEIRHDRPLSTDFRNWTLYDIENWTPGSGFVAADSVLGWLVQVHRRDPRGAKRPPRVWRSGAREVPVDPPGQALLTPALPPRVPRPPAL
jgi:predicted transcriptional regulator